MTLFSHFYPYRGAAVAGRGIVLSGRPSPFLFQQCLADFIQRLPIPHRLVSSLLIEWKRNRGATQDDAEVQQELAEITQG